jgi:serine/threonine protein kinase
VTGGIAGAILVLLAGAVMSDATKPDAARPGSTVDAPGAGNPAADAARLAHSDDAPTIISTSKPTPRIDESLRGRRLGPYEMIERVGAGGMASVLRAIDVQLGRIVALKILTPELARDPDRVTRFQFEARAAAKLDHENIARVYGCGEDQGLHFIAFEFVEGTTLRDLFARSGSLPVSEALPLLLQVAEGLAHAAERGVVHRDVKPSNIIVTPTGRAKLVDMGLARHMDSASGGVTQSGVTLGTFDYISPEQALEPRSADTRSDIYSLGCTFYHAMTGQSPVPEGTAAKKLYHHQHVAAPDPRSLNPSIPQSVSDVLARMMAKNPDDRYQRPEHLVHDVRALTIPPDPGPNPGRSSAEIALWAHAPPASRRFGRTQVVSGGAILLALAAIVGFFEWRRSTAGSQDPTKSNSHRTVMSQSDGGVSRGKADTSPPRQGEVVHAVSNVDELRELFARGDEVLRIRLTAPTYLLEPQDGIGPASLTFRGRRLELESEDPTRLVNLIFWPGLDDKAAIAFPNLDGERGEVQIRGVRFQCHPADGNRPIAAIAGSDLQQIELERCAFHVPSGMPGIRGAAAIALDDRLPDSAPAVRLTECVFIGGSQAFQFTGRGSVIASNCAFAPHHAVFHLHGTAPETTVRLEHCSALLDQSSLFLLDDAASARIAAGHCLFSRPTGDPTDHSGADAMLIRQVGIKAGDVSFRGLVGADRLPMRNAYHNLTAIWSDETTDGPLTAVTLDEARARPNFHDEDALELPQSPWLHPAPLARLANDEERHAFAINLNLARLRLPRSPLSGTLGVQRNIWGPSFVKLDPPGGAGEIEAVRSRIVDPSRSESDPAQGFYPTLAHALLDARSNETILIKKNGPLAIDSLLLTKPDVRVTLRPFPGYAPVLTLGSAIEKDAALFRLYDGAIRFEKLHFRLNNGNPYRSQAVALALGNGQISFHDCLITLDGAGESDLSVVRIADDDGLLKSGDQSQSPQIRLESCFVRGRGDLVRVHGGQRFELDLDGTLVALNGSLARAIGSVKSPSPSASKLRLRRTTVALEEHLVSLQIGRDNDKQPGRLPAATHITCECSLLAPTEGRPLIYLDGVESDEQARQLVSWTAPPDGRPNFYANVGTSLLNMTPPHPERTSIPTPWDRDRWLAFTNDRRNDAFVRARLGNVKFVQAQPSDFRPRLVDGVAPPRFDECGAPLDRLPVSLDDETGRPAFSPN